MSGAAASQRTKPAPAGRWAVRLPVHNAGAAAALRRWPGVLARIDDAGDLWLRGASLTGPLDLELRKLPGAERFTVEGEDDGRDAITPIGKRIPAGALPAEGWIPVAAWCQTALPPPALPARRPQGAPLTLARSNHPAEALVLVTTLAAWTSWAIDAAQVRLRRLSFASSSDGRVVVRGSPMPPIEGRRYVEQQGVAVPAGWKLCPAVDAATIHALLVTSAADLVIFAEDGSCERIDAEQFVVATRSAARLTSTLGPLPEGE